MRATIFPLLMLSSACGSNPPTPATSAPTSSAAPSSSATPSATAPTAAPSASSAPAHAPLVRIGDVASPPTFDVTPTLRDLVLPQITSCYSDALAASPGLHGKMVLSFEVNEKGAVTSATEMKSTTNSAPLFACIKSAVIATAFPKPPGTATVNVPLVFRP